MYQAAAPAGRHSEPPTGVYGSYGSSSSSRAFSDEEGAPTEAGGEDDLLQEDKAVVEGLTVGGYSVRKLAKVALMLGLALVLSVFAFTNVQDQFVQTTSGQGGTFDIFKVTSLDDIPRDSIFGNFSSPAQQKLFAMFLEKYSKDISPEDYGEMFRTFKYNLDKIDNRNADEQKRGGTARHGINKFTGWTDEQLAKLRGAKRDKSSSSSKDKSDSDSDSSSSSSSDSISTKLNRRGVATPVSTTNKYSGTATSVDWSDVYTTAIRDQGYCGGCWAFSAVAQMESDGIRQGLLTTDVVLSPQQLISCSSDNDACDGGWTEFAFSYAMTEGIELDSDYPYTSYDEDVATCAAVTSKEAVKVDAFYVLTSETAMIDYVMETGPLSVCVDSANWDSYVDGIVSSCGTNVDHCVQLVGVDLGEGSYKVRFECGLLDSRVSPTHTLRLSALSLSHYRSATRGARTGAKGATLGSRPMRTPAELRMTPSTLP